MNKGWIIVVVWIRLRLVSCLVLSKYITSEGILASLDSLAQRRLAQVCLTLRSEHIIAALMPSGFICLYLLDRLFFVRCY